VTGGQTARVDALIGVDIGGSGVKAAVVDVGSGRLLTERLREPTPTPATPEAVCEVVASLVDRVGASAPAEARGAQGAPVGCTIPSVVTDGVVRTAANIDDGWIGVRAAEHLGQLVGRPVTVLNDADAAGIAEVRFGAGRDAEGTVVVLTLGTGIGSALFRDGVLVPNTEFGHAQLHGDSAERWAAASVRKAEGLSWSAWAVRLSEYLEHLVLLVRPRLVVLGGGVSRRSEKFLPLLDVDPAVEVVPASLANAAGIVGAAMASAEADGRIDVAGFAPDGPP
jgi:polyphosphate glucokinase